MNIFKNRHRMSIKTIAMVLVCLFAINNIFCIIPARSMSVYRDTLAPWSILQKALQGTGITISPRDEAQGIFEIIAGMRLLLTGKTYSAVNGILIEAHRDTSDIKYISTREIRDKEKKRRFIEEVMTAYKDDLPDVVVDFDIDRSKDEMIVVKDQKGKMLGFISYGKNKENHYIVYFHYVLKAERQRNIACNLIKALLKEITADPQVITDNYILTSTSMTNQGENIWKNMFGDEVILEKEKRGVAGTDEQEKRVKVLNLDLRKHRDVSIEPILSKKPIVRFLSEVQRDPAGNRVKAKFVLKGREGMILECEYTDTETKQGIRKGGDDITALDAGFSEIAPTEKLTYENVFQQNDIVRIVEKKQFGNLKKQKVDKLVDLTDSAEQEINEILAAEISFDDIERQMFPYEFLAEEEKKEIDKILADPARPKTAEYLSLEARVALKQKQYLHAFRFYMESYYSTRDTFLKALSNYKRILESSEPQRDKKEKQLKSMLIVQKKALVQALSKIVLCNSLITRRRYFNIKHDDKICVEQDNESQHYSITIMTAWHMLDGADLRQGDVVLDAFGGSGGLLSFLISYDEPQKIIANDINYGVPTGDKKTYAIIKNLEEVQALFNFLPRALRLKLRVDDIEFLHDDVAKIKIEDESIDKIFADPPYGFSTHIDMAEAFLTFLRFIKESHRILKPGGKARIIVPRQWIDFLSYLMESDFLSKKPRDIYDKYLSCLRESTWCKFYKKPIDCPYVEGRWTEGKKIIQEMLMDNEKFKVETVRIEPSFFVPATVLKLEKLPKFEIEYSDTKTGEIKRLKILKELEKDPKLKSLLDYSTLNLSDKICLSTAGYRTTVYRDPVHGDVIYKVSKEEDATRRPPDNEACIIEARVLAELNSLEISNTIPQLLAIGVNESGSVWVKLRSIENGRDLDSDDWKEFSTLEKINIFVHIAKILQVIHKAGWCHNDIHPGNILFNAYFPEENILIDFGLANKIGAYVPEDDDFKPPERYKDVKSEIYSFGKTLEYVFKGWKGKDAEISREDSENSGMDNLIYKMTMQNKDERIPHDMEGVVAELEKIKTYFVNKLFVNEQNRLIKENADEEYLLLRTARQLKDYPADIQRDLTTDFAKDGADLNAKLEGMPNLKTKVKLIVNHLLIENKSIRPIYKSRLEEMQMRQWEANVDQGRLNALWCARDRFFDLFQVYPAEIQSIAEEVAEALDEKLNLDKKTGYLNEVAWLIKNCYFQEWHRWMSFDELKIVARFHAIYNYPDYQMFSINVGDLTHEQRMESAQYTHGFTHDIFLVCKVPAYRTGGEGYGDGTLPREGITALPEGYEAAAGRSFGTNIGRLDAKYIDVQATEEVMRAIMQQRTIKAPDAAEQKLAQITNVLQTIREWQGARLTGPVNTYISLSPIPDKKGQMKMNIRNLALAIARNETYGLNVRYSLEGKNAAKAQRMLKEELRNIYEFPNKKIDNIFLLHDKKTCKDLIEVKVENIDRIDENKTVIHPREYIVALKDDNAKPGISIPNYTAALTMGLSLAALRVARDKIGKHQEKQEEYENFRNEVLDKFRAIYKRYEVTKNGDDFSIDELELMVTGSSAAKLYYTILYALPPMVKGAIEFINQYHKELQFVLGAA